MSAYTSKYYVLNKAATQCNNKHISKKKLTIIQLARSPLAATSKAPRMARSTWRPRIIPKDSELEKMELPFR